MLYFSVNFLEQIKKVMLNPRSKKWTSTVSVSIPTLFWPVDNIYSNLS